MKRLPMFAVLSLVCACVTVHGEDRLKDASVADAGLVKEGLQLKAHVVKETFRPQEAILISVIVNNGSDRIRDE
jgi:hypothetical protein